MKYLNSFFRVAFSAFATLLISALAWGSEVPRTETSMLSGTGPDDAVSWGFTIDGGRRADEKARIPVPSNWQQHGFGHYQYGYDKGPRAADTGMYRHRFSVPAEWKGRNVRLVFDAVMTDTTVKVNGQLAGPLHQGGFNRFSHDVAQLLKVGEENEIEVKVSEASAATATDIAERHGDYWVFGGIYRPVWLEASPPESIGHVAIAAQASGELKAQVELRAPRAVTRVVCQVRTLDGVAVGKPFMTAVPAGGSAWPESGARRDLTSLPRSSSNFPCHSACSTFALALASRRAAVPRDVRHAHSNRIRCLTSVGV